MFSNICKVFFIYLMPVLFINAQEKKIKVFVGEIKQNIDPRMSRYTKLFLEKAKEKEDRRNIKRRLQCGGHTATGITCI